MNKDLGMIYDWFKANKLSINASKTKYVVFETYNHVTDNDISILINIEKENLDRIKYITYLGLNINQKLDWNKHSEYCQK